MTHRAWEAHRRRHFPTCHHLKRRTGKVGRRRGIRTTNNGIYHVIPNTTFFSPAALLPLFSSFCLSPLLHALHSTFTTCCTYPLICVWFSGEWYEVRMVVSGQWCVSGKDSDNNIMYVCVCEIWGVPATNITFCFLSLSYLV